MTRSRTFIVISVILALLSGLVGYDVGHRNRTDGAGIIYNAATYDKQLSNAERLVNLSIPEGYEIEEAVVLSRHHIRSPHTGFGSDIDKMTTHQWYEWTSPGSELSLKGGILETELGQFFRKYLIENGFMEENEILDEERFRIYANSKQRTIATAQYFLAGFMPTSNMDVEYHCDIDVMDPVFNPVITAANDTFMKEANEAISALSASGDVADVAENLKDDFTILEDILDFTDSAYAKEKGIGHFATDDTAITLNVGEEPTMSGGLKMAIAAADALSLQYYEDTDDIAAGMGRIVSNDEWEAVGRIIDTYQGTLFVTYPVAINVANPLLKELKGELENSKRKFSYLCGHDSNIQSVLAALEAEDHIALDSIIRTAPLGCKLTFLKLRDGQGNMYVKALLIYQDTQQIRETQKLDKDNVPAAIELSFEGIERKGNGLYSFDDVIGRFDKAIAAYERFLD